MPLTLIINGQQREFDVLTTGSTINALLEVLGLKADRIAMELNGEIAPRASWASRRLDDDDKIELVHFVGGGNSSECY